MWITIYDIHIVIPEMWITNFSIHIGIPRVLRSC